MAPETPKKIMLKNYLRLLLRTKNSKTFLIKFVKKKTRLKGTEFHTFLWLIYLIAYKKVLPRKISLKICIHSKNMKRNSNTLTYGGTSLTNPNSFYASKTEH